jgi:broad specificity phosphatase PhoE
MSRIVLVRHGETVWHAENRYAGSSDIELSPRGRDQAQALAWWAANAGLERLYVSPLGRARETARPVERVLEMEATVDSRLRELDFGDGEGLTSREMGEHFPSQYAAFRKDPVKHFLPGGEDPVIAIVRGRAALADIAGQVDSRTRVLLICHNTLIRLLLCDLLGISPSRYRDVFPELGNVSISEIALSKSSVALLHFNAPILALDRGTASRGNSI